MTDKATDVTLKPCPKCGGRAFIAPHPTGFPVWCSIDRCLRLPPRETKAEAIAAWNHRTASEQPASGEAIEAAFREGHSRGRIDGHGFEDHDWQRSKARHALSTTSEAPEAGRLREALSKRTSMSTVAGGGQRPHVEIRFASLADAHDLTDAILNRHGKVMYRGSCP